MWQEYVEQLLMATGISIKGLNYEILDYLKSRYKIWDLNFLTYINSMKGFHWNNSIHSIPWTCSHPPLYFSVPPSSLLPSFSKVFGRFHYNVFICIYVAYFSRQLKILFLTMTTDHISYQNMHILSNDI
jgi:hypothetical protein